MHNIYAQSWNTCPQVKCRLILPLHHMHSWVPGPVRHPPAGPGAPRWPDDRFIFHEAVSMICWRLSIRDRLRIRVPFTKSHVRDPINKTLSFWAVKNAQMNFCTRRACWSMKDGVFRIRGSSLLWVGYEEFFSPPYFTPHCRTCLLLISHIWELNQ